MAAGRMEIGQLVLRVPELPDRGILVTLAPPMGERDPRYPLRGREALLEHVVGLCHTGGGGKLIVLHGLGGSGKTAVALEAISRTQECCPACRRTVWWIDARHEEGLLAGLRAVARQTGLQTDSAWGPDAADVLWNQLSLLADRWLLVLDGVDDTALLDGPGHLASGTSWIRPQACPSGVVIVTTRNGGDPSWGTGALLLPVKSLQADKAAEVLLDHTGDAAGPTVDARELARRLGGLPLALHVAGSYLAEVMGMPDAFKGPETPGTFAAYVRAMEGGSAPADAQQAVAETWRMSIELMRRRGFTETDRLLEVLAAFSDAPIPHTLLLRPAALASAVDVFSQINGPMLWRMLKELASLGLLDLVSSAHSPDDVVAVRLHPLIRDLSRTAAALTAAVRLVSAALELEDLGSPEDPERWAAWQALTPHALELADQVASCAEMDPQTQLASADMAEMAARHLQALGLFEQARQRYEAVLSVRRALQGDEDPATLDCRHLLASAIHDLGDLPLARAGYQAVWEISGRVRGEEHTDTLTARHELGRVLHDQGHLEEAHEHLVRVFTSSSQLHGPRHPYTLTARHEVARVLHDRGRLAEARAEYEAILKVRREEFGAAHPGTLTAQHNLAAVLHDQGRLQQALMEYRAALTGRRSVLGEKHPRTLHTQYKTALVLRDLGDGAQATELMTVTLQVSTMILGASHPQTARTADALRAWGCDPAPTVES
ncbi:tetratricopeptide repeat protein [Streptomyces sp. Ag82_O1-15]|uniref:tetratricopeptide repeat protein n=1 Tax=Streptomyces sp. Ag82_O1-15 TaxID=1938855 RepID=UPI0011C489E9|nr:tetratricopeptide repeat protein [Streptomyces sp. Ag82_O1-15]